MEGAERSVGVALGKDQQVHKRSCSANKSLRIKYD